MLPPGAVTEIKDPLGVALISTTVAPSIVIPPLPPTIPPLIETFCALIDTPFAVMPPPETIPKLDPPDSAEKLPPTVISADTLIVLAVTERFPVP